MTSNERTPPPRPEEPDSDDFADEHTDTDVGPAESGGPEKRRRPHRHVPSTDPPKGPVI